MVLFIAYLCLHMFLSAIIDGSVVHSVDWDLTHFIMVVRLKLSQLRSCVIGFNQIYWCSSSVPCTICI